MFVPESLRQGKLRHSESRVPQRPRLRRMQNTQGKHAAMVVVSVCVRLHVCNTIVSLHMKIWERFCFKLKNQHFKRISDCLHLLSMDGGSPTPPRNMIITFILCNSCKRFNTSEVVRNFIHQQHPSRLFLWLPRV